MEIRKLSESNGDGSYGVTLPKDDLRERGLLDGNDDSIDSDQYLKVKPDEDSWFIELV